MYCKRDGIDLVVVGVCIDDLLITGTASQAVNRLFESMSSLSIKDLGPASKFLSVHIRYTPSVGYHMDQEEAINDLLREHGLEAAYAVPAPIGEDCYESLPADPELLGVVGEASRPSIKAFQLLVGSLFRVARCTHPDIAFAVYKAIRQAHQPRVHDWKLAKRIARYLMGPKALNKKMHADENGDDGAWHSNPTATPISPRTRTTGSGVVLLNGMVVSWVSKKQGDVSLSTMEADFVAASHMGRELLGIHELLGELEISLSMPMHIDNHAAIKQIDDEASSLKAKHIDVRLKFICDFAQRGVVQPQYVRPEQMLTDLLTKTLCSAEVR